MKDHATYSYCHICGHTPKDNSDPCNLVRRFWDTDDGWKIGALCVYCWQEVENVEPKEGDYAYDTTNGVADDIDTDEDPALFF